PRATWRADSQREPRSRSLTLPAGRSWAGNGVARPGPSYLPQAAATASRTAGGGTRHSLPDQSLRHLPKRGRVQQVESPGQQIHRRNFAGPELRGDRAARLAERTSQADVIDRSALA